MKYEKFENLIESERRKDVLTILEDTQRTSEDKFNAIELLLRDLQNINKQYVDLNKSFVICEHTLNILRGQLDDNTQSFLNEWTFIQLGKRICKYCGEEVNTIDGVKIDFEQQWVHLRKSNTEPIIRIYTESNSQQSADELAERFITEITEIIS